MQQLILKKYCKDGSGCSVKRGVVRRDTVERDSIERDSAKKE